MSIHRSRDVKDIYSKVRKVLQEEGRMSSDIKDFKLLFRNALLNERLSLEKAGIIDRSARINLIFEKHDFALIQKQQSL